MFKKLLSAWLLSLSFVAFSAASVPPADEILGLWVMPDGSALIEVYKANTGYAVRILALRDEYFTIAHGDVPLGEKRQDVHNPDKSLRKRLLTGLDIAWGLEYADGIWLEGDIYDPGSGSTYSCELELVEGGLLKVRGYMGFSLLGRTLYWQRAKEFKSQVNTMLAGLVDVPIDSVVEAK